MASQPGFDPAHELEKLKKNEAIDAEEKKRRKYTTPYVNLHASHNTQMQV